MGRFALDIETIPLVDDPDFRTPAHWRPFAIALGHDPGDGRGATEVDVFFREDDSLDAEEAFLTGALDWIADRSDGPDHELLTYNGDGYDLPILNHRASEIGERRTESDVVEQFVHLVESNTHTDLIQRMKARNGYFVSLDDALAEFSIEADAPTWLGSEVTGADMPSMGAKLLESGPNDDLRDVVYRYAASDVEPLFELHDELLADPGG